jgi:hypothetical protein
MAWRDATHGELRLSFTGARGRPELFFDAHDLLDLGAPERQPGEAPTFVVPVARRDASRALPRASDVVWTLVGLEGAPRSVEGRSSVALAPEVRMDWRWLVVAVALAGVLGALFLRRRPAVG